jgi:hypothetical protein
MKTCLALAYWLVLAGTVAAQLVMITGPQQPPAPTGNGLIEGTVINELTREPVRKAQVTLGSANAPPAVTDATGRFVFRNLAAGTFWLQASHPQFPQSPRVMQSRPLSVTLGQDEQKHDLVIALTPGATISGTVLDEDGKPLADCNVNVLEFQLAQPGRKLGVRGGAASDSRGQYRISSLPAGRYYLVVQCQQILPAPHPFIRAGPGVDLPKQRYTTEFYPGPPEASGAGRFTLAAGADSRGIDFHVRTTATITLRGRFSGDLGALRHNPWLQLRPSDPLTGDIFQYGGMADARRNTFRIEAVPPGRYLLVAIAQDETHAYQAKMPIDIGAETPPPIEVAFLPGSNFTGSIEWAGDQQQTLENAQVRLIPLDSPSYTQTPFSKIEKDKSFALSGVVPGRWRLQVDTSTGYVKSLIVGDRPMSPHGFTIGPGSGGVMRIVVGAKSAQIEGTVTGSKPDGATNLWLMAAPDDPDRIAEGAISVTSVEGGGHFTLAGIEPGKYRLYAFAGIEPWAMQQNPSVLKTLEGHAVQVDLEDGTKATTEVPIIPIAELLQALQEHE